MHTFDDLGDFIDEIDDYTSCLDENVIKQDPRIQDIVKELELISWAFNDGSNDPLEIEQPGGIERQYAILQTHYAELKTLVSYHSQLGNLIPSSNMKNTGD